MRSPVLACCKPSRSRPTLDLFPFCQRSCMASQCQTSPISHSVIMGEQQRLDEDARRERHWKRWGADLSERAWGTVREDYSPNGTAWEAFPHDHARSRAYRWNEDGLAG